MNQRNTDVSWGAVARALHWLMAAMILLQFIIGWIADTMARSPDKVNVMTGHKSLGITILLLALCRLLWRWSNVVPLPLADDGAREVMLSRVMHGALYVLMLALPLSGWLTASTSIIPWKLWWSVPWPRIAGPDTTLHELAGSVHVVLVWVFLALLATHVSAALWHQFIKRDRVLSRMWKGD